MIDALVERLNRTAGDLAAAGPEGAVIRGDKTLAFATDISDLLTAYATVQAERDAARAELAQAEEIARWHIDHNATLRETLVGEVRALKMGAHVGVCEDGVCPYCENVRAHDDALDPAITIIKGTP